MSIIRERFIKIVESLPYNIQDEINKKKTFDILKDVTQKYYDTYGVDDLSDEDKELIHDILGNNFAFIQKKEA